MNEKFKELLLGFIIELNSEYGYKISIDKILQVFKLYEKYDFFDENEITNCLQSILCNNHTQYENFDKIFHNYFYDLKYTSRKELEDKILADELKILNTKYNNQEEIIEKEKELINNNNGDDFYLHNKDNMDFIIKKTRCTNVCDIINIINLNKKHLYKIYENDEKPRIRELESSLEKMLICNIENNLGDVISERILLSASLINEIYSQYQNLIKKEETILLDIEKDIKKVKSKQNRDVYIGGKNAVQTESGYIYKDLTKLDNSDLEHINRYIKQNANKLKLNISKNLKSGKNKIFDYNKVIKNCVKTDMVPLKLFYKKPRKNKVKIICILDISGSCKNASQILMSFIYSLQEVFTGGVESYVFVKHLNKVTEVFKNYSIEKVNEIVSTFVERDYSDYNTALKEFDEKYYSDITKDSIVIYLGDARNNKNLDGSEYLSKIKDKIKSGKGKMYWINPEPINRWNQGDSIIAMYKKYMDKVVQIRNTSDLINFLNNINI